MKPRKRLFLAVGCYFLGSVVLCQAALILSDAFNYNAGANLGGQGNWINDNTGDEVAVVSGNLSVSGLEAASGNKVSLGGAGVDPYQTFASRSVTTYYSVAFRVTSLGSLNTSGGYILGLASGASFAGAMWLRNAGGGSFNIGISKRSTAADVVWSASSFSINSVIFLVGNYEFNAGAINDVANLWINPDAATFSNESAPTGQLTTSTTGTDSSGLTRFYFRQDDTGATPGAVEFDELRVGASWADVTPVPEPAEWALMSCIGLAGICGVETWRRKRTNRTLTA